MKDFVMPTDAQVEAACAAWWEGGETPPTMPWAQAKSEWKPDYRKRMLAALIAAEKVAS